MTNALETKGLTKRYRSVTALSDCSIDVPEGRVSALVGPNGAGKTTLLRLVAGLASPSAGSVSVLGRAPTQDPAFLASIGFLAQDIPLWKRMTAADHIAIGAHLNPRWDGAGATDRIAKLGIPLDQRVGTMSGGQRAQVALSLALAKKPQLLLLDEPVAALDPLARRHFLATLADAVTEGDLTVVLSSHLVADLQRICDHLILLSASRPQLCGDIETILAEHAVVEARTKDTAAIERDHEVIEVNRTVEQSSMLVRLRGPIHDPKWHVTPAGLEEIVLAYMGMGSPAHQSALFDLGAAG